MAYLKTFGGSILLRIENDQIKEFSSGMIKYKVNGNKRFLTIDFKFIYF